MRNPLMAAGLTAATAGILLAAPVASILVAQPEAPTPVSNRVHLTLHTVNGTGGADSWGDGTDGGHRAAGLIRELRSGDGVLVGCGALTR